MAVQPGSLDAGTARPGKRRKLSAQEQVVQSLLAEDRSASASASDSERLSEEADLDSSDQDDDASVGSQQQERVPNKGASFARAFSRILAQPDRFTLSSRSALAVTPVTSVVDEQAADKREGAHHLRQHLRHRNHQSVPRKGEDPQHDAAEKTLAKLATRGVVRLFNAVSKAQQQHKAPLRHKGKAVTSPAAASFATGLPVQGQTARAEVGPPAPQPPGWDVLQQNFDPFSKRGGTKLKDWDKPQNGSESEAAADSEGNSLD